MALLTPEEAYVTRIYWDWHAVQQNLSDLVSVLSTALLPRCMCCNTQNKRSGKFLDNFRLWECFANTNWHSNCFRHKCLTALLTPKDAYVPRNYWDWHAVQQNMSDLASVLSTARLPRCMSCNTQNISINTNDCNLR